MSEREPTEIEQIAIPVLVEAVAVTLFIAMIFVWMIIKATPVPA